MKNYVAVDIGSLVTKIYLPYADVVLREPTLVAVKENGKILAYGQDAQNLYGKSSENVKFVYPVVETEIKESKYLAALLKYFFAKIKIDKLFSKPKILLSAQCGVEMKNLKEYENLFATIGYYDVCFVESPVLSLLGANAPISANTPAFVIDFGAGQTTIAAITLSGIISGISVNLGGRHLDETLKKYIEDELNLKLTVEEVERIKLPLASLEEDDHTSTNTSGKDALSGKSKSILIFSDNIYTPLKNFVDTILGLTKKVLDKIPEAAMKEIEISGVYVTGGGANIFGIADYVGKYLDMKCTVPDSPELCCITGAGMVIEDKELLKKLKLQ